MRAKLKNEIKELITGKQNILVVHAFRSEPGFFYHQGKKIDSSELELLSKQYNKTVIFKEHENKT
jgi:hypothetical protein